MNFAHADLEGYVCLLFSPLALTVCLLLLQGSLNSEGRHLMEPSHLGLRVPNSAYLTVGPYVNLHLLQEEASMLIIEQGSHLGMNRAENNYELFHYRFFLEQYYLPLSQVLGLYGFQYLITQEISDSGSSSWRHKSKKTLVGHSLRLSATIALAYLADRTQLQIRGFVAGFMCLHFSFEYTRVSYCTKHTESQGWRLYRHHFDISILIVA